MFNLFETLGSKSKNIKIFKSNLHSRFEGSKRYYFDFERRKTNLDLATNMVFSKLTGLDLKNGGYLVFIVQDENGGDFEIDFTHARECNIDLGSPCGKLSYYDNDNEWFVYLQAFKCDFSSIISSLKGELAASLGYEPYLDIECFIVSNDLSIAINLYDDRGMDIANLKCPY